MEKFNTQAAVKVSTFETSRTRRSLIDGNIHSEDSNNVSDEEYASSGFYVREKSNDKKVDKSVPNSPKPLTNGENSNDVESNPTSEAPQEKITNGDDNILNEDEAANDKVNEEEQDDATEKPAASEEVSDNDNRPVDVPNEEPIPEVTAQTFEQETENLVDRSNDNVIDDDVHESNESKLGTNDESEPSEQKLSELTNKEDEEGMDDKLVQEKISEEDAREDVKQAEPENGTPVADSSQITPEKTNNDDPAEKKDIDDLKNGSSKSEESKAEEGSEKETEMDCDVAIISDSEVRTDTEKNDLLGAVELTPKGEEAVDVDLTNNDSETVKPKDSPEKGASILKSHLAKASESEDHDGEIEDDFDPSLFCPDISMDVEEAPVVTNENHIPDDGSTSPLLYQPIFSTLVDEITGAEVQVDLTPEEMEMRHNMYGPDNPVQKSKVHCTACNVHLGSAMTGANNRFVHPLLKVLICKNCYHFYTSGEFEKDEDGSELYCRWCGQGGQVLCCSSCEFVFCKRCIRNNFGVKKFKEIRNSDDWNCFRCDPGQLSSLRASCAEFMEYYRTELARAYSLSATNPELMTTDYTTCCSTPAIKKEEASTSITPRTRRKRKDDDPDYSPMALSGEPPAKKPVLSGPGFTVISNPSMVVRPIAPKPTLTPVGNLRPVGPGNIRAQSQQTFKVGNTVFRSKGPNYTIQRPNDGTKTSSGYVTISSSSAKTTTPGYIKLVPSSRMSTPNRGVGNFSMASGSTGTRQTFTPVRATKPIPTMPTMKHEWFEKTVRAAARVNSNLSYTLTQLNRQQSQAANVESLAVVHNKLQEVLSTTINSLIQIRKNLRTEFISGIRNVKFPPKPAVVPPPPGPIVVKDDDDVIFVSQPSTTQTKTATPPPLLLSPSVTLSKAKSSSINKLKPGDLVRLPSAAVKPINRSKNAAGTITTPSTGRTTGFLKVRSLKALQNVPSECIIIPDDPPEPPKTVETYPIEPLRSLEPQEVEPSTTKKTSESNDDSNSKNKVFNVLMVYNVLKKPSPQIRKMMDAVVNLERSPEIDELNTQKPI